MHSEEHCNRNVGIVEKIRSCHCEIQQSEDVRRDSGRHGHRRDAEEVLTGKADQEQEQIDVWREKLSNGNFPPEGGVGHARHDQRERKQRQGKG